MRATKDRRRLGAVAIGTLIGSWLSIRLQFGTQVSPYVTEELALLGLALVASLLLLAALVPATWLVERLGTDHAATAISLIAALLSTALGLWIYVGLLHRPFALTLARDWPGVLCFGFGGAGYAAAYVWQRRP
ncbi:hypothetical protein NYO99_21080 [Pelomonas sp. UHG3]|uniref:Uncharacterized protein n=1 Tax=Roseateles hydrophilus TaxID=2975054 RepID=A0ACC6CGF5_9BURK|nr:hypothetical protein [Pelomonas sp. UHG3]MCY4747476.1 hypothetical protein [Pelomonas sp. UHG3]